MTYVKMTKTYEFVADDATYTTSVVLWLPANALHAPEPVEAPRYGFLRDEAVAAPAASPQRIGFRAPVAK